jgi:peptidoglycan/LPS O-acetylase OafA/YrhL
MLVVAFHAGLTGFDGGFIGVDMFFVLSGYLITGLLVREASNGRVDLRRFYARRSRRLLPASLLVIVTISVAWLLTASFVARRPLIGDARAASLYVANWHFAAQATDYFAIGNQPSPFLHFWSLAVEEQFYFVWPALVVACGLVARRFSRASHVILVRIVGSAAALASLCSVVITTHIGNDSLAYFGTHNRVYQLLGGAVLGTVTVRKREVAAPRITQSVSLGVLVFAGTSAYAISPTNRGLVTTAATLTLLWSLTVQPTAPVARLLSTRPLVWLGTLSYAIYLWHWPLILLAQRFVSTRPALVFGGVTALSVAIAALSTRLLEQPIRSSVRLSRHHIGVVATGLALSAAVGLGITPRLLESTRRPAVHAASTLNPPLTSPPVSTLVAAPPETVPSAQAIASVVRDGPRLPCLDTRGPACLVSRGHGRTMLVIGDSHLHALVNGLAQIAQRHDLTLWVYLQHLCPWQVDLVEAGPLRASCRSTKQRLYNTALPGLKPDVVFTVNRGYDDPAMPTKFLNDDGSLQTPASALVTSTPHAVDVVLQSARRLIILEPWPAITFIQRDCLATAGNIADCAGAVDWPLPSTAVVEAIAARNSRVRTITLNDLICPRLPLCDAVVGGFIVRVDHNHLNYQFGLSLTHALETRLAAAGAFATTP